MLQTQPCYVLYMNRKINQRDIEGEPKKLYFSYA